MDYIQEKAPNSIITPIYEYIKKHDKNSEKYRRISGH